jgi:hypothetical protein
MKLTAEELGTILAALRFYQSEGMGDPDMRTDDIHDIATDGDSLTSLDDQGIDALCDKLSAEQNNVVEQMADHLELCKSILENVLLKFQDKMTAGDRASRWQACADADVIINAYRESVED